MIRAQSAEGRAILQAAKPRGRRKAQPVDLADVLAAQIHAMRLPMPVREHRFDPVRRWRMDLAWPDRMLFAEVDGGEWSHGRHGRGTGMQSDAEKWNAATLAGWAGLQFTGSQVRSGYAIETLQAVFRGV